ncbi:MAG: CNP1-like family protein [Chromatiaceae bacterium]
MQPRLRSHLALALLLVPCVSFGARGGRDDAFVPDPEPPAPRSLQETPEWTEGRVDLPPWPRDEDLIEFQPDMPGGRFRFYIDGRSLSVDTRDGVVRYALVAESPSGVRNVSFEGIRCTLRGAYRVYAYGTGDGFSPIGPSDWSPIPNYGTEAFRRDLWRHSFCVPREPRPRTKQEILRTLRGSGKSHSSTGFQAD